MVELEERLVEVMGNLETVGEVPRRLDGAPLGAAVDRRDHAALAGGEEAAEQRRLPHTLVGEPGVGAGAVALADTMRLPVPDQQQLHQRVPADCAAGQYRARSSATSSFPASLRGS